MSRYEEQKCETCITLDGFVGGFGFFGDVFERSPDREIGPDRCRTARSTRARATILMRVTDRHLAV